MRRWVLAGLFVLLVGCGGQTPPGGLDPLRAAQSLSEVTTVPHGPAEEAVAAVLYVDGDMSSDYDFKPPVPYALTPNDLAGVPPADATLSQLFFSSEGMYGAATMFLYADPTMVHEAYDRLILPLEAAGHPPSTLGEEAWQSLTRPEHFRMVAHATVVFVRCRVVVFLQGAGNVRTELAPLVSWASKMDQRIQESAICAP